MSDRPTTVYTVVKLRYSHNPWRIVNQDGAQLCHWVDYPVGSMNPRGALPPIQMPLCFRTQREAKGALATLIEVIDG